jgi:histidyl-tRNA synthetase
MRTTFECVHEGLGAQSAIGGGGRYDGLIETLGGPAIGGVGFGLGVDRTCLAVQAEGLDLTSDSRLVAFIVPMGEAARPVASKLVTQLRAAGVSCDLAFDGRSVKAAMKAADRSEARFAVLIGDNELASGKAVVKDLDSGEQRETALDSVVDTLSSH